VRAAVEGGDFPRGLDSRPRFSLPGGDLFFASIGHLGEALKAALVESREPVRLILIDAESVNLIDTTALDALLSAAKELQGQGITIAFARVRDAVRERMRLAGIEAAAGADNFYERVTEGVRAWRQAGGAVPRP